MIGCFVHDFTRGKQRRHNTPDLLQRADQRLREDGEAAGR